MDRRRTRLSLSTIIAAGQAGQSQGRESICTDHGQMRTMTCSRGTSTCLDPPRHRRRGASRMGSGRRPSVQYSSARPRVVLLATTYLLDRIRNLPGRARRAEKTDSDAKRASRGRAELPARTSIAPALAAKLHRADDDQATERPRDRLQPSGRLSSQSVEGHRTAPTGLSQSGKMASSASLAMLVSDLQQLGAETKRKHADIKEVRTRLCFMMECH